jgi:hypothetical protein
MASVFLRVVFESTRGFAPRVNHAKTTREFSNNARSNQETTRTTRERMFSIKGFKKKKDYIAYTRAKRGFSRFSGKGAK